MSSIDQRVVEMKFNNSQFGAGIKTTLDQLSALKSGLKLDGATKGLEDVNSAAGRFSLANMHSQLGGILGSFSALQVTAVAALATITSKAVAAGSQLVKSLTIDPITAGLHEYETNLNSIQTILANTGLSGASGLGKVNAALDELNHYSDQTIYNFSEMARNIGTFTAAGVSLDKSTAAIKGIANLAAVSGSNAQQASTAMYQLSQSLASGKVSLEDWNSVVNAGMGGKVFQDSLMETARVHGVAVDDIVKKEGGFRNSLSKGWLSADILTETLSKFTGDLTAAQLKQMGYSQQQIVGILKMGATAKGAATEVKTVTQLISTLQEAAGSGWAKTWQLIIGDFDQAKKLWTGVNNVLGGMISASADARNQVLGDWNALGGRTVLIDAISNAFNALMAVLKPIKDAFRQIFPATTGKQLYDLTVTLRDFTEKLKMGGDTANNIKRTFAGFFAALDIGWQILKKGISFLFDLFGTASGGSGSFLKITANIGDFLVALDKAVKNGQGLTKFFNGLGNIIKVPINLIKKLIDFIASLFSGFDTGSADAAVAKLGNSLKPLGKIGDAVSSIWGKIVGIFAGIVRAFAPLAYKLGEWFKNLGKTVNDSVGGIDYSKTLETIRTGLLGGLVLLIKKFLSSFGKSTDISGGLFSGIKESLGQLTDTLKAMQTALKATTLLAIAGAVALLVVSVVQLSKIDSEGLTRALVALTFMFGQLAASMAIFSKIGSVASGAKLIVMGTGLIKLAAAIKILTSTVQDLAKLSWSELARGLVGVAVVLGGLALFTKFADTNYGGLSQGLGIILLATGIKILASAVKDFSVISWEGLAKGLVGVGVGLLAVALALRFIPPSSVISAAGVLIVAVSLGMISDAIKSMGGMSWEQIAKGIVALAGALGIIAVALKLLPPESLLSAAAVFVVAASLGMISDALKSMGGMSWEQIAKGIVSLAGALAIIALAIGLLPPESILSAAAIFVVAASLGMITDALKNMSQMSWEEIAKGLVALAGALGIIALAMALMPGALPGAAALLVVSAALAILAPVLISLGAMSWSDIFAALGMLAGAFIVLGVAGVLLAPVVPVLVGLAGAIFLMGLGALAAGVGMLAFAVGLTVLAAAGAGATVAIVGIVSGLVGLIPYVMEQIGVGLILFANVIATNGPAIEKALTAVLMAMMDAIITLTPKIGELLNKLLDVMLDIILHATPRLVDAGYKIMMAFLQGLDDNLGPIIDKATDIVVKFIDGIARNRQRVIQAGVDFIIGFIEGLAQAIRDNSARVGAAGADLGSAIVEGMIKGLQGMVSKLVDRATAIADAALKAAKKFLDINSPSRKFMVLGASMAEGMAVGMDQNSYLAENSATGLGSSILETMGKSISGLDKLIGGDMVNLSPTITPVLDLTSVKQDAQNIGSMLKPKAISIDSAYSTATDASAGYQANQNAKTQNDNAAATASDSYIFNQYNTSPKALSQAEIYRQTNNQLSVAKGALTNAN